MFLDIIKLPEYFSDTRTLIISNSPYVNMTLNTQFVSQDIIDVRSTVNLAKVYELIN